jgi:hypothetical protein
LQRRAEGTVAALFSAPSTDLQFLLAVNQIRRYFRLKYSRVDRVQQQHLATMQIDQF